MRKLASIQKIKNISPIQGADKIETVTVNGWNVVTKKGEYGVGDLVIYCQVDSLLPIRDEFEFLRKSSYKKIPNGDEGFRLKTIRLRGTVSQGLVLPLSTFRSYGYDILLDENQIILVDLITKVDEYLQLGDDVTDLLEIVKYEPPIPANLQGKVKGHFPSFIPKTDEERVQNLTEDYHTLTTRQWFVTEKLDGSSATFYLNCGEFGVCSRNLELLETHDNTFWKVARELQLEEKLREFGKNIAIQGELVGEGVQKNPYNLRGQTVYFFNVFDIDKFEPYTPSDFISTIQSMGLQTVPVIETSWTIPNQVTELIQYADGKSILHKQADREGVVCRLHKASTSFKVISNKFLLNEK